MLQSICQQIWKTQQWPQDWKRSVFIPIPKKGNAKECSNYHIIALIPHTSKVIMLKILQARLQQYMNCEFPDVQAGRQRNQRSNCQHLLDHWKSKRVPEKHLLLLYWLCQSLWLCGSQQTVENSSRDGNTRLPDLPSEKSAWELDMEQQTGCKSGKEYIKAVYCHPAYLTYMQSTWQEMLDWMNHKEKQCQWMFELLHNCTHLTL